MFAEFDKVVRCLALELPESVHVDVVAKYGKLKAEVEKFTSTNSARDAITPLVVDAVNTDGCHHKQWYLEAIAEALQIALPPHDNGIAP